jgi:hypothetical protein
MTEKPNQRKYQAGTCYLCQLCLTCNKELVFDICECNITEKPKTSNKITRKTYSRVYNSKTLSQLQINKLKECDEYFGYCSDFGGQFQFFLCSKCHNKFYRLKKNNTKKIKKNSLPIQSNSDSYDSTSLPTSPLSSISPTSPMSPTLSSQNITEDSIYSSSDHDNDITEFNFKLSIKPFEGKSRPAKWESFEVFSLIEFEDEILELVQNQFDAFIRKSDYTIIYKQNSSHGAGTLLTDEKDWKRFLLDYKKILSNKKDLMIIIEMQEKINKKKR